ncbi:MAG: GEVED domain-containing protein [bacterium]
MKNQIVKKQIETVMAMLFFVCIPAIFFFTSQGLAIVTADYGDNPDSYSTLKSSNGPFHYYGEYAWFGPNSPDYESNGQPTPDSTGDDSAAIDDEDGVAFAGNTVSILVNVAEGGGIYSKNMPLYIDGWIDWGKDGNYSSPGDHAVSVVTTPSTDWGGADSKIFTYIFAQVIDAPSRWRVTFDNADEITITGNQGHSDFSGGRWYGEVEDYSPVPVPSAVILLCSGLIGLGVFRKKMAHL